MRRGGGPWLPWLLLIVALIFLVLSETGALQPLASALGFIIAPVERAVSSLINAVASLTQTSRDIQALQVQVAELTSANEALVQDNFRLLEFQAENEELRRQLAYSRENPTYSYVGADIIDFGCSIFPCGTEIGLDSNPYLRYIVLNVGSRDGAAVGMPVVTGGAVMIGRIVRTSSRLSYVQLVTDPDSEVAAMLQQSRVRGMVAGTDTGGLMMLDILPDEEIAVGETIITSAAGGILPRGLILGQIESVIYQESELFQQAVIRPAVDFRKLETLLVITDFEQPDLEELEAEP